MTSKQSLTEKTAQMIGEAIVNGFYKPGDRMPNEIELADELSISRATLREAIKVLVSKNILEVRRGIGTFVSETPGLGTDPLGLDYVNMQGEVRDLIKLIKFIVSDVLEQLQMVSFEKIDIPHPSTNTKQVHSLFYLVERIAFEMDMHFKYRLIKMLHEAMSSIFEQGSTFENKLITEHYDYFIGALKNNDKDQAKAAANTFWDMILIQMEEAD